MNKEMQDLFHELKQYLLQYSMKWHTLCDIEQYILDLERKLKQSKNFIKMIKEESYQSSVTGICDTALEELGDVDEQSK